MSKANKKRQSHACIGYLSKGRGIGYKVQGRYMQTSLNDVTHGVALFLQVLHLQSHVQKFHVWKVAIHDVSPMCMLLSPGGWYRLRTHDHCEKIRYQKNKKWKEKSVTNVV